MPKEESMKDLKILHVCETAIGGISSYLNLLCAFSDGNQNIILCPEKHVSSLEFGAKIYPYKASGRNISSMIAFLFATHKTLRRENPDVIFFHSTFSLAALLLVSLFWPNTKSIYCAHGWAVSKYNNPLITRAVSWIEGKLCGLSNVIINISEYEYRLAKDLNYSGRHIIVENAVRDCIDSHENPKVLEHSKKTNLLFVGRLDHQKGLDLLLEAFSRASHVRSDLNLYVIGSAVRNDQTELELAPNVHVIGWMDPKDLDSWYRAADALVVPSRWEGFGLVVAEAFRNGTPVLCSDRGALPYLVDSGHTGEVFSLDDSSLIEVLKKLDKDSLKKQRPACRIAYEKRFSPERFIIEIHKIYARLQR